MALTDVKVRSAKTEDKPYKLTDSDGMHLLVHPNGSKYWRLRYRYLGKENTLALGVYPTLSLSEARVKRDAARKLIAEGSDLVRPSGRKRLYLMPLKHSKLLPGAGMPLISNGLSNTAQKCSKTWKCICFL